MNVSRKRLVCYAVLAPLIAGSSAFSADIRFVPEVLPTNLIHDLAHVEIKGEIVEGDVEKLGKALALFRGRSSFVCLDSPGGSVPVALEMGRTLRKSQAWTNVENNASCSSSCIFLLAGGVNRDVYGNGRIGLHRPRFDYESFASLSNDEARTAYDALVGACVDFMKEMGISPEVFSDMLRVPSQQIRFVGREYAEKYNLAGVDPVWEERERARDIQTEGEAAIKARDRLSQCFNSGTDKNECFKRYHRELREIEARHRE